MLLRFGGRDAGISGLRYASLDELIAEARAVSVNAADPANQLQTQHPHGVVVDSVNVSVLL
jgi:hypothetical protein